jgi:hypothetical protein
MKTNSEFTDYNNMTRRSTNIFNSFKLNRCLYDVTFPYLTKNRHLIAIRFAVRSITSLTGKVANSSGNFYSSVRNQIHKYSTNYTKLNNALDNNKKDQNLTSKPTGPLKNK